MHITLLSLLPGITRPYHDHAFLLQKTTTLNDGELGSRNVESVDVGGEAGESLLRAVRSDEGVDLDTADIVLLLEGGGDLALVGLDVDDEDEGVVLLDLLHGGLGVERVDEHLGGVHAGLMGDRLASVLSGTGEREGLGAAKLLVCKRLSIGMGPTGGK
jgi:hypothetical protein